MSSHDVAADHGHSSHGSLKSYIIGFILSIILTLGAFYLVMDGGFSRAVALIGILVMCVAQLLVQLVFFMHMGTKPGGERDNLSTFLFTVMIIAIIVGGSVWVLHNMNANMLHPMPN